MKLLTKLALLYRIIRWRLTWDRRDTSYQVTVPGNPKFMSAQSAAKLIKDGSVIATSGLAGNQRPSVIYWAIRELFQATGHPSNLTVVCTGGQGGRGIAPGTLEELGQPGLCTRFISGHLETFKAMLRLADAGKISLHCLPQGMITFLLEAQGEGHRSITATTGIGTFVDPRSGRGSPLLSGCQEQLVTVEGDRLRYELPNVNVAIFNAPAADRAGNIYVKNCAIVGESYEIAKAVRKNGGIVIANVGMLVDEGYDRIFLPAELVDAVVVYPKTEQTAMVQHRRPWSLLTTESKLSLQEGAARLRFINQILGITPRRTKVDDVLARFAAKILADNTPPQAFVNIGVGLPEEVARLLSETGLLDQITLFTEAGALGGLPAPGVFFGAAICPRQIISSAQMFHKVYDRLDVACLGLLQVDSQGNVNVSKRGEGAFNYVGPGGFIDLTTAAKTIIFVGAWMNRARIELSGSQMKIAQPGIPKFVAQVDEITFNGQEALKAGKQVFYVTHVGLFQLTDRGLELRQIMPGIDLERDILKASPIKVILPESGQIPLVDQTIVTGQDFRLSAKKS